MHNFEGTILVNQITFPGKLGPSWSYGSWIYNYLCNQFLSPRSCKFEPRSWRVVLDTTLCDKVYQ